MKDSKQPEEHFTEDPLFQTPIAREMTKLYDYVLDLHDIMPKRFRSCLWKDIYKQTGYTVHHALAALGTSKQEKKRQHLEKANRQLASLRVVMHSLYKTKITSPAAYQKVQARMLEIGRMLGGLIRSIRG